MLPAPGAVDEALSDGSQLGARLVGCPWPVTRHVGPFGRPADFLCGSDAARPAFRPRSHPLTTAVLDLSVGMDGESAFRSLVDRVRS